MDSAPKVGAPSLSDNADLLTALDRDTLQVLPGGMITLAVRYESTEFAVAGKTVEFAVITPEYSEGVAADSDAAVAPPPGAALSRPSTPTDAEGTAETLLTVGSTLGTFQVRARVEGVEPVFFTIEVTEAAQPTLKVHVEYDGLRTLAAYSATAIRDGICGKVEVDGTSTGAEVRTVNLPTNQLNFTLGNHDYAILAWGRDATNATQAVGCTQLKANEATEDDDEAARIVEVPLTDRKMRLQGPYPIELVLSLDASLKRLGELVTERATLGLPDSDHPEADLYLDAVQQVLSDNGEGSKADQVEAARSSELASSLETALGESGYAAAALALTDVLEDVGNSLAVQASFAVGAPGVPLSLTVNALVARSNEGKVAFDLMAISGNSAPAATITAEYDDLRAQVDVTALGISLPLGTYGRALIDANAQVDPKWYVTRLAGPAGCAALSSWLASEPALQEGGAPLCDGACASQVCETVLGDLVSSVQTEFLRLDVEHPAINLGGAISAHNRLGDERSTSAEPVFKVDDLGPSTLKGNWGKAMGASEDDAVSASVVTFTESVPAL
jgi:hypothetical protein